MINIGEGIAAELIGLLLIVVIAGIVWWVAKAVMKQAVVAIVISVVAGVAVAWVLFAGGLEFLVGQTQGEATDFGARTVNTIPYDFGP